MPDRVEINEGEYRRTFETREGLVGRDLDRRAARVERGARAQVGVDTGGLQRSIHRRWTSARGSRLTVSVGSSQPHALVHHAGSRPHEIRARNASPLRYVGEGGVVTFAEAVRHPGTRPNRYLTDNLRLAYD